MEVGLEHVCPDVTHAFDAWTSSSAEWYGVKRQRMEDELSLITTIALASEPVQYSERSYAGTYNHGPWNDGHGAFIHVYWHSCAVGARTLMHELQHHCLLRLRGDADHYHESVDAWDFVDAMGERMVVYCIR